MNLLGLFNFTFEYQRNKCSHNALLKYVGFNLFGNPLSRPPRARGLKHDKMSWKRFKFGVAPPTGAWIETGITYDDIADCAGRAPHGRVD